MYLTIIWAWDKMEQICLCYDPWTWTSLFLHYRHARKETGCFLFLMTQKVIRWTEMQTWQKRTLNKHDKRLNAVDENDDIFYFT